MKLYSTNEWGKLREVIIGNVEETYVPKFFKNPRFNDRFIFSDRGDFNIHKTIKKRFDNSKNITLDDVNLIDKRILEERKEDVENLCDILRKEHISVLRPKLLNGIQSIKTPYWESLTLPAHNVRDLVLIIKDMIIETSVMNTFRYFETDLFKDIFYEYFKNGCKWISAPKPTLQYIDEKDFEDDNIKDINETEIMFDAAQILRFGDKLLFNISTKHNYMGYLWLKSILQDKFEIYPIERICYTHIDGAMMPLEDGVILYDPIKMTKDNLDKLPDWLKKWKFIPAQDDNDMERYTGTNVLVLGDKKIIINAASTELIKKLNSLRYTCIPVQLRHNRMFVGAFHCISLDTVRDDV